MHVPCEVIEMGFPNCTRDEPGEDTDQKVSDLPKQKTENEMDGVIEELKPVHQGRRPKLSIDIPPRSTEGSVRINATPTPGSSSCRTKNLPACNPASASTRMSPCPPSAKGKPSLKSLLPGLSFKFHSLASEVEDSSQLPEASSRGRREKPSVLRSFSFAKIFSPTIRRASSLPTDPVTVSHDKCLHGAATADNISLAEKEVRRQISRSLSVPLNNKAVKSRSIDRMNSLGGVFRVIPSTPKVIDMTRATSDTMTAVDCEIGGDGDDIPEEEAVCRICMTELSEGSDTLKLECSCKGELALAHQECALKWFSIKGNRNCDVCKQEVQNLPVTLLRIQSVQIASTHPGSNRTTFYPYRFWHDMPVLVIVSMLAYFCFLEELLVRDDGTAALAISLPFSCIIGLFASLTSSTMVMKPYVWVHATIQFLLVVFFAHLFYSYLHMQPVISIVLAAFAGFGVAISGSSIIVELLRWRRRWYVRQRSRRSSQELVPSAQQMINGRRLTSTSTEPHEVDVENPVTPQA